MPMLESEAWSTSPCEQPSDRRRSATPKTCIPYPVPKLCTKKELCGKINRRPAARLLHTLKITIHITSYVTFPGKNDKQSVHSIKVTQPTAAASPSASLRTGSLFCRVALTSAEFSVGLVFSLSARHSATNSVNICVPV